MNRKQAHVGMLVLFGRDGEPATVARILKVNRARAKVVVIEGGESKPVGSRWNVPYAPMQPVNEASATGRSEMQNEKQRNARQIPAGQSREGGLPVDHRPTFFIVPRQVHFSGGG